MDRQLGEAVHPAAYNPDTYLPFAVPGFGLVVALIFLTLLGFLTANLVGRTLISYGENLLGRMPFVRSLYRGLKQIFETVLSQAAEVVPDGRADRVSAQGCLVAGVHRHDDERRDRGADRPGWRGNR